MIVGMKSSRSLIAVFVFFVNAFLFAQQRPSGPSQVPFVGCSSDGQVGPLKAPVGSTKTAPVSAGVGARLAYYKAENGFGILGPRGWHCFSTYGSNGSTLYVSPEPIDSAKLFSKDWKGFIGQAIQVSVALGDTSGRFEVARTIARVFPDRKAFVRDVIAEEIEPSGSFSFGPYPKDGLTYRSKNVVEFETPAGTAGLGTNSRLRSNSSPIIGVAILFGDEPNLLKVELRFQRESDDLVSPILAQIEREAANSETQ